MTNYIHLMKIPIKEQENINENLSLFDTKNYGIYIYSLYDIVGCLKL